MKKLYTLGIALSMVAFGTQSMAQLQVPVTESSSTHASKVQSNEVVTRNIVTNASATKTTPTPKDDEIVYFTEDFSNGLGGQLDVENGAWTVGEAQGALWFQTFPVGETNGYDPAAAILGGTNPLYGTNLAVLFSTTSEDVVNSPTRDNGVMMVDADRFNALSTVANPNPWPADPSSIPNFSQYDYIDTMEVKAALISPAINMVGVESALLTFFQGGRLQGSATNNLVVEVSVNGQANWTTYDVYSSESNSSFDAPLGINISDALQQPGADLENVHIRFYWPGKQTHYYWTIDDVKIVSIPGNDLVAGTTYTNNWETILPPPTEGEDGGLSYMLGDMSFVDYINAAEYNIRPQYYAHLYNFGMVVTNTGGATQTGVKLMVVATAPDGTTTHTYSMPEGVEFESGVVDTLWINGADLSLVTGGTVLPGNYKFKFEVVQDEIDEYPLDNIGATRTSGYTSEGGNGGYAVFQNGKTSGYVVYNSAYTVNNGFDMSNATGYVFPELESGYEAKFITHVEVAFIGNINLTNGANLVTTPGNDVYFNVRKNHPYDEVDGDASTESVVLFGTDEEKYVGDDIVYTIAPEDLGNSGSNYKWTSFELPTPVAIEPGVVYMAEIRVPAIGNDRVHLWGFADQPFVAYNIYFAEGPNGTGTLGGGVTPALRFRTGNGPDGIEKITFESGLTLIQNYPNPFTDVTRIQYAVDKSSKVNFEVRDLTGKLVYTRDLGNVPANAPQTIELQRGNLAAGMYTYTIATSEFQVSRKLTVE